MGQGRQAFLSPRPHPRPRRRLRPHLRRPQTPAKRTSASSLPFLDKGYRIVTKPLKRFAGGSVKANFDVELAIDILTMADRLDVIGLISGDGDFRRLVEIVSARGVRVEVVAFGHSTSKDIREVADRYIDIAAYVPELCESK